MYTKPHMIGTANLSCSDLVQLRDAPATSRTHTARYGVRAFPHAQQSGLLPKTLTYHGATSVVGVPSPFASRDPPNVPHTSHRCVVAQLCG